MKLVVRHLTETDLEVAGTIAMAAYERTHSLEAEVRRNLALQPDGWYLALLDDTPVGLGGAVDYGPFAYLGLMSVLPAMQGHGIGMALMKRILAWLDDRQCPTVLLNARPRAVSLYKRCGFVEIDQTLQLHRAEQVPVTQPPVPLVTSISTDELPAVAAFDALAFGANRLAALSDHCAQDTAHFLISRDIAGQLTGLLVARQGTLGPWNTSSVADAECLLRQALALPFSEPLTVSLSARHHAALDLLARYGFQVCRTLPHMRRGQPLQRDTQFHLYAMDNLGLG
jgi:GNAT superfamily N-acetyltransferase